MAFKKKWLLIVGIILLILITLHFVKQSLPNSINIRSNLPGSDITEERLSELPSCGDKIQIYNSSPILSSDYFSITPLGNVYPISGHVAPADHLYLHIRTLDPNDKKSLAIEVPFYSPGNVKLLRVDKIEVKKPIPYSDYSLFFSPCNEVVSEFHHATSLSNKILEQLKEPAFCDKRPEQNYCIYYVNIPLASGETIGTAGGNREKARDLDFETYDFRVNEAGFVNKRRYTQSQLHKVCPFDYFTEEIKTELYNKSHTKNCGEFMQDIPGTLQGNWVQKGQDIINNEDYVLSLMHINFDIKRLLFSLGKKLFPIKRQTGLLLIKKILGISIEIFRTQKKARSIVTKI